MNLDPAVAEAVARVRRRVRQQALFYTPFALGAAGIVIALIVGMVTRGSKSNIGITVLLAILGLLLVYQAVQSWRDVFSPPAVLEGQILRRWSKLELLAGRGYYLRVGRNIMRTDRLIWEQVQVGERVRLTCLPHTQVVVAAERLGDS